MLGECMGNIINTIAEIKLIKHQNQNQICILYLPILDII